MGNFDRCSGCFFAGRVQQEIYFSHLCSETDTGFLYHKTYRLHSNILQVLLFKHLLRIAFKSD